MRSISAALAARPWLGLWALALVAFGAAVDYPFLHWDDPSHLVDNPLVVSPFGAGLGALFATPSFGYPAPATVLGWSVEHALFGMRPAIFHATNLVLHGINVWLLHRLVVRLRVAPRAAAIAAAIFALHPVVTEPVVWVTGRKDLQATAFVLAALVVLLGRVDARPSRQRLAIATGLAIVAMLSKPTTAIAPILLVLAARHAWPELGRKHYAGIVPLFVVAITLVVVGNRGHQALTAATARTTSEAVHQVLAAWALQLQHLLAPVGLLPVYYDRPGDPSTGLVAIGLGLLGLLLFVAWRERQTPLGFGLALFVVTYLPVAAILPNRRWVADSYLYLPLAGFAIAVGVALDRRWPKALPFAAGLALLLLLLTAGSFLHARTYASNASLWERAIERYADHPPALALYGMGLSADHRDDEAAKVFVHIAKLWPDHPGLESNQAWAFLRLGLPARARERLERGAARGDAECRRALESSDRISP